MRDPGLIISVQESYVRRKLILKSSQIDLLLIFLLYYYLYSHFVLYNNREITCDL